MKIEVDTVKGFQDFLPPESLKRSQLKNLIEDKFKLFGFLPLETPIVEFDELMRSDSLPNQQEDEAISDRFKLKDRAGRNLGLRYEFTFQLSRLFKQNPNIKLPLKRYQIGPVFRDEPVKQNRFRQFTQCDIDILGDPSTNADVECLACFSEILKDLKIQSEIYINNKKLIESIIKSVQIPGTKQVMRELDKLNKISEDEIKQNLRKYASANQILTLFKILEKDLKFFKENAFDGSQELQDLLELCKSYNLKPKFSPTLMRGFSYYTGNIFEIRPKGSKDSIAGGGRYDKTVGKYLNREIPAVGFSFGLERLSSIADLEIKNIPKTLLVSINQDSQTLALAKSLRKKQIPCSLFFAKPGKALEYANSYQIPFTILIGENEVEQKKFTLKDMQTGEEKLLTEKQLIQKLSKN